MNNKIAVIGDTALDFSYLTRKSEELSAETNLPVNYINAVAYDAGGAGNLASNIAALGRDVDLYGLCGCDFWGDLLISSLNNNGVGTGHFHKSESAETYVYHRIFDGNGIELPRYDYGQNCSYSEESLQKVLFELEKHICEYSLLIVNQQLSNSVHTTFFSEELNKILNNTEIPVWVDTRSRIIYRNCSYKINLKEAIELTGASTAESCAQIIYRENIDPGRNNFVVITLGQNGALAFDGSDIYRCPGIELPGETDSIGAGDAFLAALCTELSSGIEISEALNFANCAGAACSKFIHRCGHPRRTDIMNVMKYVTK